MSTNTTYGYTGTYPATLEAEVITNHIYGVRRPDGTTAWDTTSKTFQGAATDPVKLAHWQHQLRESAVHMHINPDEYIAGHQLLRRTAIIAITAPEEV